MCCRAGCGFHLQRAVVALLQFGDGLLFDVETKGGKVSRQGDGRRQTHIAQTDDGNTRQLAHSLNVLSYAERRNFTGIPPALSGDY